MQKNNFHRRGNASHRTQDGVSLLFALIALVALMLATLGLIRSVDTSSLVLGNIGFKQDATAAADQAAGQAINWLSTNKFSLNSDQQSKGYYARSMEFEADGTTAKPPVDATWRQIAGTNRQLIDWDGDNCQAAASGSYTGCTIKPMAGTDVGSNKVQFAIFRLCSKVGDYTTDTSIQCAKYAGSGSSAAEDHGDLNYTSRPDIRGAASPYFRIVVRVAGARNTVSFTETIVHF